MDITQMIVDRLESNDQSIREMAKAVSELAQAVARKEVSDQHFNEAIRSMKKDIDDLYDRQDDIEKLIIKNGTGESSVMRTAANAVVQFVVLAGCGGILWAIVQSYRGG